MHFNLCWGSQPFNLCLHLLTITSNDSVNTGYPDPMNSTYYVETAPETLTSSTTSVSCSGYCLTSKYVCMQNLISYISG